MNKEKIKQGLAHCRAFAECDKCVYFHTTFSCYESLHEDALMMIMQQEQTIGVLMELNQKLAQELQNIFIV